MSIRSVCLFVLGCVLAAPASAQAPARVTQVLVITFSGGANLPLWIAEGGVPGSICNLWMGMLAETGTPEEFRKFARDELDGYAKVVKAAGIKVR
jgi:hypothetical protein